MIRRPSILVGCTPSWAVLVLVPGILRAGGSLPVAVVQASVFVGVILIVGVRRS
jgi:hypothetical protein